MKRCRLDHYRGGNGKENSSTLGSSCFFCRSWFKTSAHSANLPDWKCNAASLASATATVKTPSSVSVPEEASRLAVDDGEDDGKSRDSMSRSSNRIANRYGRGFWGRKRWKALKLSEEMRSEMNLNYIQNQSKERTIVDNFEVRNPRICLLRWYLVLLW